MLEACLPVNNPKETYLDGFSIKFQALFLVGEELLNILALVSLELDHLTHLAIHDDGAIASCVTTVRPKIASDYQ